MNRRSQRDEGHVPPHDQASADPAPGRRTAVAKRYAASAGPRIPARGSVVQRTGARPADWSAAFDFSDVGLAVQDSSLDGRVDSSAVQTIAAEGVARASQPLPYAELIQASFGRHHVSGIQAATGGAAADASAAIGARAYATGDRVAFADTPDLHTAAHEAAHVVQQRAGVHLAGGVGQSGDAYEQHADRVADIVVVGGTAEAVLDEMAGGGARGTAVQRFDSPHHVAIGDSVEGEAVNIRGIDFTPGELTALVDYVGPVEALWDFQPAALTQMKVLLAQGIEDAEAWDAVTGGLYSKISLDNGDHFAPPTEGVDGGANYRDRFLEYYTEAITRAQDAGSRDGPMEPAYLSMANAEHYLLDAFSAGHRAATLDVNEAVNALIDPVKMAWMIPVITARVYDREADVIANYGRLDVNNISIIVNGGRYSPIDTKAEFIAVAGIGAFTQWIGGLEAAMRKYVHEQLDHTGVEVTSPAHPDSWILYGDHSVAQRGGEKDVEISVQAMRAAIADMRETLESAAMNPAAVPKTLAAELFAHHCPTPTDNGTQAIADAIVSGTESDDAFVEAVTEATCITLIDALDTAVSMSGGYLAKLSQPEREPAKFPHIGTEDYLEGHGPGDQEGGTDGEGTSTTQADAGGSL